MRRENSMVYDSNRKKGDNYQYTDKYATAPYNFVPYDAKNLLKPSEDNELYSGTITCSLKALTPLLVAGATDSKEKSKDGPTKREFFKLNNGKLVIPGSSLKGMLRSHVEALSRSFISIINDKKLFYRNVTGTKSGDYKERGNFPDTQKKEPILGGYIVKDGSRYQIYPATITRVDENTPGAYKTGPIAKKTKAYMFGTRSKVPLDVPPEVMKDFFLQMTEFQKSHWKDEKKAMEDGIGGRIFYTVEKNDKNKIHAVGVARYFIIGYAFTPQELARDLFTAEKNRDTDFALHLFGCANKEVSYKGKVSVEPAYFSKFSVSKADELTCILGSPHATDLLHYLYQPKVNKPQGNKADDLSNYNDRGSSLRGRKFYWHRDPEKQNEIKNQKVASNLKPIEKGSEASFVVHLDKVNATELGVILKVLTPKEGHALKLGAGKSVGFGSVEIDIVKTDIKDVSNKYLSLRDRILGKETNSLSKEELDKAVEAFEQHALMKNETSFDDQKYVKEYYAMTDFKNKPNNELTKTMPLEAKDGDPNFAKSKAMLLDPISVAKGNCRKEN